jgi:hypothetical protein
MQVTCQICRKKIEKDTAYKRAVGKTNKYYCSEQEWQEEEDKKKKEIEDKNKVYNLICDMFGYQIQNSQFFAEWTLWNKLKSNEIIYKYLRENEDYLCRVCDKSFNSEYQKIRYFSAILKNSLRDYKPKVEVVEKPKVVMEEHYETKYKPKVRQALDDFEEDCDEQ